MQSSVSILVHCACTIHVAALLSIALHNCVCACSYNPVICVEQKSMMNFVRQAIQDADVLLFLTDLFEAEFPDPDILQRINDLGKPLVVAINKVSCCCCYSC
jgi:hypothetical protein